MRAIPMILVVLVAGLLPAQDKVAARSADVARKATGAVARADAAKVSSAKEAVSRLQTSLKEVLALGKLAEKPIVKLRRKQKVKTAVSPMRMLSKHLRKMSVPEQKPEPAEIMKTCEAFSKALGDVVLLADQALTEVNAAIEASQGFEKKFYKKVHGRLYVQVAYAEITSYFVNNQTPGTFDGMFPKTAALGRKGALAMLDLFVDLDQQPNVRTMAGEGVAQLGNKDDIPSVKDVHDDQLEEAGLRRKAMFVLARLGDRGPFEQEAARLEKQIKEVEAKRDTAEKDREATRAEYLKLSAVENPTDEQKAELAKLKKAFQDLNQSWVNAVFGAGNGYVMRAGLYLEIRDHKTTEESYKKALENWLAIGGYLQAPQNRQRVNIAFYNLACVQSLMGKPKEGLASLENAFRWTYADYKWVEKDGDLANVRKLPEFKKLLAEVKSGEARERWKKEVEEARKKQEQKAKKAAGDTRPDGKPKPDGASSPTFPTGP